MNHASLTGADLHEPKGIASAAVNKVYVSDGAGSGVWQKVSTSQVDTSFLGLNTLWQPIVYKDLVTARNLMYPIRRGLTLTAATGVINNPLGVADVPLTFKKNNSSTIGTITIAFTSSAIGSTFQLTGLANNTFVSGDYINVLSTPGSATGTVDCTILLQFTVTS